MKIREKLGKIKSSITYSISIFLILISSSIVQGQQYQQNNSASSTGNNCFILTPDQSNTTGQVWYNQQIDLSQSFELYATLNFGVKDTTGGNGISFSFHQGGIFAGVPSPGNMGYNGIIPSLVVEMDTYQNTANSDPADDHVSLIKNGNNSHTSSSNLVGPVITQNLEDGSDHQLHVKWDPSINNLKVWLDCSLVIDYTDDIVNSVFGSDPNVNWGFTGGTSSETNLQTVCINYSSEEPGLPDQTTCAGSPIILDAGFGDSYMWSPSAGLNINNIQTPLATPTSTTTYTVTIYDSCGNFRTDSYLHTVIDSNTATLSGDTVTCEGTPVPLNLDVTGTGPFSIQISNGNTSNSYNIDTNGRLISNGQKIMVSPTTTSTYTISSFTGQGNCANDFNGSATVTIGILSGLQSNTQDATCNGYCDGAAQVYIPHSNSGYTYIWPNQTGGTSKSGLCGGNYDVVVNNGAGCQDTIALFVNEPASISISPLNDIVACQNETISVSTNVNGGSGNYLYTWSTSEISSAINVWGTDTTTYSVTVTDDNNCPGDDASFDLNVLPPLELSVSSDTGLCFGDTINLSASGSGGDGNYNYVWNDPDTTTNTSISVNPDSTTYYTVSLTDGCGSPTQIDSVQVFVDNYPSHDYSFTDPACVNQGVLFDISNFDTSANYEFNFGIGDSYFATDSSFYYPFPDTGCYDITLSISTDYCDSVRTDSCAIKIFETPKAEFTYNPDTASILTSYKTFFQDKSEGETNQTWYIGGTVVSDADTYIYEFQDSGYYDVELIVSNDSGCFDTTIKTVYVMGEDRAFFIPNAFTPNGDGLNDFFGPRIVDRNIRNYRFTIYSRWGDLVFETDDFNEFWDGTDFDSNSADRNQETYIWRIQYRDFKGNLREYDGTVLLYR